MADTASPKKTMPSNSAPRQRILLAYVFEEFEEHAKVIEKKFAGRVLSERFRLVNLNSGAPNPRRPVDVSIDNVDKAILVVLLLGEGLGGSPTGSEQTYVQLEANAAIRGKKLLPIVVGSYEESKASIWSASMLDFVENEVQPGATIGDTRDANHEIKEDVATTIIDRIERCIDELEARHEDRLEEVDSPLSVSGFSKSSISEDNAPGVRLSRQMRRQLAIIYSETDEWQGPVEQKSSRPDQWRQKDWALKNVRFGNPSGALKNLTRVVDNYGSDLMANFWMTRLWSRLGPGGDPREAFDRVELGVAVATDPPDYPARPSGTYSLIASLIYTHGALIARRISDPKLMHKYIGLAEKQRPTFELTELRVELDLEALAEIRPQGRTLNPGSCRELRRASDRIRSIFDHHLGYYAQMIKRLDQRYGEILPEVIHDVRRGVLAELGGLFKLQEEIDRRLENVGCVVLKEPPIEFDRVSKVTLPQVVSLCRRLVGRQHVALRCMAREVWANLGQTRETVGQQTLVHELDSRCRGLVANEFQAMIAAQQSRQSAIRTMVVVGAVAFVFFALALLLHLGGWSVVVPLAAVGAAFVRFLSRSEDARISRWRMFSALQASLEYVKLSSSLPKNDDAQDLTRFVTELVKESATARRHIDDQVSSAKQRLAASVRTFIEVVERFEDQVASLHGGRYITHLRRRGVSFLELDGDDQPDPLIPAEIWSHIDVTDAASHARRVLVKKYGREWSRWYAYFDESLDLDVFLSSTTSIGHTGSPKCS